jgi:phenylacetate 2-hydroxylase
MSYPIIALGIIAAIYLLIRHLNATDVPKIKGLPEIPGVPIFGNLIELGTDHARVARRWARKYGPVFQTRLGNRVSRVTSDESSSHDHVSWTSTSP